MRPEIRLEGPSTDHLLGTDSYGRDVAARLIYGSRVSITVGLVSVLILTFIGVTLGLASGYKGALVDSLIMRIVDVMMSIPPLVLMLALAALFGASARNTVLVIGLTSWMGMARLVRGQVLTLKEREYVSAAKVIGCSDWRLLVRHVLPNAVNVIVVNASLLVAVAIVLESTLSYLGVGVQPPRSSWGNMLREGQRYMRDAWWLTVFPGLFIFLTAMAFNILGDGIRDLLDPRSVSLK